MAVCASLQLRIERCRLAHQGDTSELARASFSLPMTKKNKILCIDDEREGLVLRKFMLEAEGYRVWTATNGIEGLDILANSAIDAVVLDFRMPKMDGAEVARAIRTRWPDMPLVMLSGYPEDVPEQALKLVNGFLTKGGTPEQLFLVIEGALKGHQLFRITILNVDDTDEHRYAVTRQLRKAGFNVIEAKNGREALEKATTKPNLIILDVNLPDMLGFDVARRLRSAPQTRQIPIIHLSATYPSDLGRPESSESGAVRFLEHPHDLLELIEAVREELRRSGQI